MTHTRAHLKCASHSRSASRRRGAVLVLVMWLLMIVMLLVLGLLRTARVSATLGFGEVERVQAQWMARAGLEQALAVLASDLSAEDSRLDDWYESVEDFANIALAEGFSFRVTAPPVDGMDVVLPRFGLDDESSKFNVNAVDTRGEEQLRRLRDVTAAQADALLDWIDDNEEARPGGAERGYYSQLEFPYEPRNGPMRTLRELMLVKGIDDLVFFGEDGNLNGRLDRNENDGDVSWPSDTPDRTLEAGLASRVTVYSYELNTTMDGTPRINVSETDASVLQAVLRVTPGLAEKMVETGRDAQSLFDLVGLVGEGEVEDDMLTNEVTAEWLAGAWEAITLEADERLVGLVNVNTASREVLESVPGMEPAMADAILAHRSTQGPFIGVGRLLLSNLLTKEQFKAVAGSLTVRSHVMRVSSEGRTPSGTTATLTAVVDRGGESVVVLDWRSH